MTAARTALRRRRVLTVAVAAAATALLVVVVAALVVRSPVFHRWLRDQLVAQLSLRLGAHVTVGGLRGDLRGAVVLRDLTIAAEGERIVAIRRAQVRCDVVALVTERRLRLTEVAIDGLALRLVEDGRGWNVSRLGRAREDEVRLLTSVAVEALRVTNGSVKIVRPRELWGTRDLALAASAELGSEGLRAQLVALSATFAQRGMHIEDLTADLARGTDGSLAIERFALRTAASSLRGRLALGAANETYDVFLEASPLAAAELQRVTRSPLPSSDVTGTLRAAGPAAALAVASTLRSAGGALDLAGHVDVTHAPPSYDLAATLAHLDLQAVLGPARPLTDCLRSRCGAAAPRRALCRSPLERPRSGQAQRWPSSRVRTLRNPRWRVGPMLPTGMFSSLAIDA